MAAQLDGFLGDVKQRFSTKLEAGELDALPSVKFAGVWRDLVMIRLALARLTAGSATPAGTTRRSSSCSSAERRRGSGSRDRPVPIVARFLGPPAIRTRFTSVPNIFESLVPGHVRQGPSRRPD